MWTEAKLDILMAIVMFTDWTWEGSVLLSDLVVELEEVVTGATLPVTSTAACRCIAVYPVLAAPQQLLESTSPVKMRTEIKI